MCERAKGDSEDEDDADDDAAKEEDM